MFPQLAGRRLFYIEYTDLDPRDVETIRKELEGILKYGTAPSLLSHLYEA